MEKYLLHVFILKPRAEHKEVSRGLPMPVNVAGEKFSL